jgi:predicted O-methyltransferase YrrM
MRRIGTYTRKARLLPTSILTYVLNRDRTWPYLDRTWPLYLSVLRNRPTTKYSLGHLRYFGEIVMGPVQRDEALFLYGLVKIVDPKTIVEFGFSRGHSATNFLKAMSSDSRLYSYDISDASVQLARRIHDNRFRLIHKSQVDFDSSDVDHRRVDFAFFDASHDCDLNLLTFDRLRISLSDRALIAVHDTGSHWLDPSHPIKPHEREFVNHVRLSMPDFDLIHLDCTTKYRHGLTLLQRNPEPLPV